MTILKKETKDNNRVELTIRVEKPEWQKALDDAYQANRDLYPVDGCAPGKATRQALEQAYAPDVFYQEAVNETFPRALVEAFGQEEILVAGAPELRIVDIGPEGFTFAALAELYPEVKLGKYKGLAAPMPQAELSNDDVDKAESEWLQAHLVEEERDQAAMGDEVTLDFDGSVDGVPFDGGKAENYPLLLGSGMFIDGFEEQVAGIRPEEEREIHVTFPQQYTPELAGKAAVFRVQAHRIVRRSMPELNDEFARAQGFSDAAALRQAIMSAALQRKEAQARDAYADALVRQVLDGMEVRVPDSMVESQLTGLLHELESRLMSQGASLSDYLQMAGMTEEDLRAHARENALESARYELAMTEIARLEHIRVTDEDVERRYQEMSRQFGVPVVVAVNRFPNDLPEELALIKAECERLGVRAAESEVFARGGAGGEALAQQVLAACREPAHFAPITTAGMTLREKIETIARRVYGAAAVEYSPEAEQQLRQMAALGLENAPVCIAKTQYSLSDDAKVLGRPAGHTLHIRGLSASCGAGFAVALAGSVLTMPGLPTHPAAMDISLTDDGKITGLF